MSTPVCYLDPMTGHGPFRARADGARPNILFISTDMVPPEYYRPNATAMRTPNLQNIRDNHLFFSQAYCTSPLCSPSRAAYLSGRHSYITTNSERAHDGHAIHLRPDDILFPEYLKAVGYSMRHVGKSHVGTHKFTDIFSENDAPWDRWSPPWHDDDGYLDFLRQQGFERFGFAREIIGGSLTGQGIGSHYGGWIAPQNGRPFPKEATYPAYLVDRAVRALQTRPDNDAPFYLQLDFFGPHQPFAIPAGMEEREQEIRAGLELPSSYRQLAANDFNAGVEPRVYTMYRRSWGLRDPGMVLDYRVANQLQFELIDELVDRLFAYLRQEGLYDNTWIVFIADHGEMNGENALIDKGAFLNPRVIQAPICLKPAADSAYAGLNTTIDRPVSLLDIAPTVLDIVGINTDTRLDGVSLLDTVNGTARPDAKPILFEVWSHAIPNPCVGTVFTVADGKNYMFTFNATDPMDELYALNGDCLPVNLWADEASQSLVDEAVAVLHTRMAGDQRWKSYKGFLELTYPERLAAAAGDRQLFI